MNPLIDSQVEREEAEDREDSSSHDTTSVSSSVAPPPLPPADLETLVLFNDLSLSSKTLKKTQNQPKKTASEQSSKNQDFFDPLSSALANDSSEELPDFLRR